MRGFDRLLFLPWKWLRKLFFFSLSLSGFFMRHSRRHGMMMMLRLRTWGFRLEITRWFERRSEEKHSVQIASRKSQLPILKRKWIKRRARRKKNPTEEIRPIFWLISKRILNEECVNSRAISSSTKEGGKKRRASIPIHSTKQVNLLPVGVVVNNLFFP